MKRITVNIILLSILLIFSENLFAKGRRQLSSFLRNISGAWEKTDSINGDIHRTVWTFDKLVTPARDNRVPCYTQANCIRILPMP